MFAGMHGAIENTISLFLMALATGLPGIGQVARRYKHAAMGTGFIS